MKAELDLSNYATKADLKNATGVDTSKFAKKVDLSKLSDVAKINLLKRLNMMNWLKMLTLLRLLIPSNLVKKTDYDTKISEIEKEITDHDHSDKYVATKEFCSKIKTSKFSN